LGALRKAGADGVIVGSAVADAYAGFIGKDGRFDEGKTLEALSPYARGMKAACVTRV